MRRNHLFSEFVKDNCYNTLYRAAENFIEENWEILQLYTKHVHKIGSIELVDATIQRVYARDSPGLRLAFDVGMELELLVHEANYRYDETDQCFPWIRISCEGDLSCALSDWKINEIKPYDSKQKPDSSLSDSLVPYISGEQFEMVATEFLKEYYPEALQRIPRSKPAISVDPLILAERLGLQIREQCIREDASIFGQIYFEDADAELYDECLQKPAEVHIEAGTIVVDPHTYLMRGLGSVNNTIIHECVHWVKHRKAFMLEKLFNENLTNISCKVVGDAAAASTQKATDIMEIQANKLAPRIQMPAEPFKSRAKEYIEEFLQTNQTQYENEVMEQVIDTLAADFHVTRQAARIRLVELGFEAAMGAYVYLEGHYARPHMFAKGVLKANQTFSISAQDAAIERMRSRELSELTKNGDYLFIENHYVYNAPAYIFRTSDGRLSLSDYARAHMDECCLVFDLEITSRISTAYHTECFLNRESGNVTFELRYHNGYGALPPERQIEMRKKQYEEELSIRRKMTDDPAQCMELLLKWRDMNYTELGYAIDRNPKTISRVANGGSTTVETVVLICFGLNLPPIISEKLLEVFGCKLTPARNPAHGWINEALHIKYPEPVDVVREYLADYGVEL